MTPADAAAMTRDQVNENGQPVTIRRYSGTGPGRAHVDTATRAFVRGFAAHELVGGIVQGDRVAIALVEPLALILPVTPNDKLVIGAKELAIKNVVGRLVGGTLVALEIQAAG
jgi:hypothetical protein